eukprot:g4936.t1
MSEGETEARSCGRIKMDSPTKTSTSARTSKSRSRLSKIYMNEKTGEKTMEWTVCLAKEGSEQTFVIPSDASVKDFTKAVQKTMRVACKDQIILYGPPFKRLSERKPLMRAMQKEIFVFDRNMLVRDSPIEITPVEIGPQKITLPPIARQNLPDEVTVSSSPVLRVLSDYAQQYFHDLQIAKALIEGNRERVTGCYKSLRHQANIQRAWEAATTNLQEHCEASNRKFRSFGTKFREHQNRQTKFLARFDSSLQRLCRVYLHPKLRAPQRTTLVDCVPINRLKRWASECTNSQEQLHSKLADLDQVYRATTDGVRQLSVPLGGSIESSSSSIRRTPSPPSTIASADVSGGGHPGGGKGSGQWSVSEFRDIEENVGGGGGGLVGGTVSSCGGSDSKYVNERLKKQIDKALELLEKEKHEIVDALEKDYDHILKSIERERRREEGNGEDSTHEEAQPSVRTLCDVLEIKHQKHQDEMMPTLNSVDVSVSRLCRACAGEHTSLMQHMHKQMYLVSVLQSRIREQGQRLGVMRAALEQLIRGTNELKHVERMPTAYVAALREVISRRAFKRKYIAKLERVSERLAKLVESERSRRENFAKLHGGHLPPNLLIGLAESPSYCDIRMRQFDMLLPDIDDFNVEDLVTSSDLKGDPKILSVGVENNVAQREEPGKGSLVLEANVKYRRNQERLTGPEVAEKAASRCAELECENARLRAHLKEMKALSRLHESGVSVAVVDVSDDHEEEEEKEEASTPATQQQDQRRKTEALHVPETARTEVIASDVDNEDRPTSKTTFGSSDSNSCSLDLPFMSDLADALGVHIDLKAAHLKTSTTTDTSEASTTSNLEATRVRSTLLTSVRSLRDRHDTRLRTLFEALSMEVREATTAKAIGIHDTKETKIGNSSKIAENDGNDDEEESGCDGGVTRVKDKDESASISGSDDRGAFYGKIIQMISMLKGQQKLLNAEIFRKDEAIRNFRARADAKISFRNFEIGSIALFLPAKVDFNVRKRVYVAFHHMCPRRFLSDECVDKICDSVQAPDFVLGRITAIDARVAIEENNAYSAPLGATYYLISVELLAGADLAAPVM